MRFETAQHIKLGQHMKLAPRMIQSMEILQMPLVELEERIEQELESNPTLEQVDGSADEPAEAGEPSFEPDFDSRPLTVDERAGGDEFSRLDRYEADHPEAVENAYDGGDGVGRETFDRFESSYTEGRPAADGTDSKFDAMAATPARGASLADQLRGQWALTDVDDALRAPGELIISFLDDDGYLRTPLDVIADRAALSHADDAGAPAEGRESGPVFADRPTVETLERALRAAQLFLEPPGVAARTPAECMLLQLDAMEDDAEDLGWPAITFEHARLIVEHHLDDITQNRLPRVAEKTGLTMEQIKEALGLLKRLSLSPGRRLVEERARPVVPDAIVEYDPEQDRYVAYLNDTRLPNLRINQEYARLAKDRAIQKRDREFIKTNLGNAQWLLDAVGQRRQTLLRVVSAVVEAQRDFFDYGPQALKPLPMTAIAEQLGIHVATVSRAVAEKHLATPRGIVPLRKFFSGGVQTKPTDTGEAKEDLAWEAIKAALRDVIEGEDKKSPLSDEALAESLRGRGIDIARRTVAKYRDQLGIQPARLRRTY
ncbi:MAG: RNA polymerase factor sigma-54 [Phycisphaeraceae bacterium]|nr:RNA polymerase factor sigma-54 [Phycisphaeraceae bacterium]MBX3411030.1 RNA polymerase factor sigma-54 [Phycisphaeraceae bacterium]